MPRSSKLFTEIISGIEEGKVKPPVKPKGKTGRPRSPIRKAKEEQATVSEFVNNFETMKDYRPEPLRLVKALALPEEKQQAAIEAALNPRQRAFCREYVLDFNGTQAAIRAGYAPKNAQNQSFCLMQYQSVRKLIDIYNQSKAQQITTVDKDYIIQKVTEIVTTAAKDSDKLRGLELLARHLGMFIERTEISGRDGEAIKIEETRQEADEVAKKIRALALKSPLKAVS